MRGYLNYFNKAKKRAKKQAGVALVLFVISLLVILTAIGFAVDSYMLTITKTQYQAAADAASLAALKEFYDSYTPSQNPHDGSFEGFLS